jgi:hypothetical protein
MREVVGRNFDGDDYLCAMLFFKEAGLLQGSANVEWPQLSSSPHNTQGQK